MRRKLISSGSSFEREIGYSRAVVDGEWVFVSGTTGFDYQTMTISKSVVEQTEQAVKNIQTALVQAGGTPPDAVGGRYLLPQAAPFPKYLPVPPPHLAELPPSPTPICP